MPRTAVSSLVRRAFAARRPLDVTSSSCCRPAFAGMLPTPSHTNTTAGAGMGYYSQQNQQRAGLSTLRRGLTGPLSSRLRLPMRSLEDFRDPEIVKVCYAKHDTCLALGGEATLGRHTSRLATAAVMSRSLRGLAFVAPCLVQEGRIDGRVECSRYSRACELLLHAL